MKQNLLLIFTKNPVLGKVKTRLARDVGAPEALHIFLQLVRHTQKITEKLSCKQHIYYTDFIPEADDWKAETYEKRLQKGEDLGERMANAFRAGFEEGFASIVIIGSDNMEISKDIIALAFLHLQSHDLVFGPAFDGGYYLLGMNTFLPKLFEGKEWSTDSVLKDSLSDYPKLSTALLPPLHDIDTLADWVRCKEGNS
jgi:rSAM/selenodomain-associated transferase 1